MRSNKKLSSPSSAHYVVDVTEESLRIVIDNFSPSIDCGRFTPKVLVDEMVHIEADIYMDTQDILAAHLRWKQRDSEHWQRLPMQPQGNDRWTAPLKLEKIGLFELQVEAWLDTFGTYLDALRKKVEAKLKIGLEIEEGLQLLTKTLNAVPEGEKQTEFQRLQQALEAVVYRDEFQGGRQAEDYLIDTALFSPYTQEVISTLRLLFAKESTALYNALSTKQFLTYSPVYAIRAERTRAEFASWYELFPRSQSGDASRHGTFLDVIARLPDIQAMGFDTLYLPPIHPIGRTFRKGKNNSLTCAPDDPGSPYAIGAKEGGHTALHPEIGSWRDFRKFCKAAKALGMEIAMDFAIQCAPDHPWLTEHPEWFNWRPDGSVKYAENPPKQYQDIVNVNFYGQHAIPALWIALKDIVLFWAKEGVRTFRVDNPHTKPFPFWEWLIAEVQAVYPDTIFLAEAFTTPKVMDRLAKVGFTQSYTYFTWRNTKPELTEYLLSLNAHGMPNYFRPNFFVNTPDINPYYLQQNGRNGFLVRAALAATTSGLWGISSGFELCEAEALEGTEEFNHSEKYEIRVWDWKREGNIIREISQLNQLRQTYPQLQTQQGIAFHATDNEQVIVYSKQGKPHSPTADSILLIAVNLSANHLQDANIEVPVHLLGLDDHATFEVHDLMSGVQFTWQGKWQQIRLDPSQYVFVIWEIKALAH